MRRILAGLFLGLFVVGSVAAAHAEMGSNKLAANKLATNKLAANKLGANGASINTTAAGTLENIVAVEFPDGTIASR